MFSIVRIIIGGSIDSIIFAEVAEKYLEIIQGALQYKK